MKKPCNGVVREKRVKKIRKRTSWKLNKTIKNPNIHDKPIEMNIEMYTFSS